MSISPHNRYYTALQLTWGTRLSIPHCYYDGNVAMVHNVCALQIVLVLISNIHQFFFIMLLNFVSCLGYML